MNAIELADYLDAREIKNPYLKEAATMLRQLQAENEALKAEIAKYPKQGQSIPCKYTEGM